jgi:hypothetical protein
MKRVSMVFDDADGPPLSDDGMPAWADADAEIAAMQVAEDRHVVWLCDNGREDEPSDCGIPAWFYKALYLDEP